MFTFDTKGKVPVREILIRRQDGSPKGPYEVFLGTWEEADLILRFWAKTSPGNGYFETCNFKVIFEDANTYSGTYTLKQQDSFNKDLLPKHIKKICEETGIAWDAQAFLERYDIPLAV